MRVRKPRTPQPVSSANSMGAPVRFRKITFSLSSMRIPLRSATLFGAACALLVLVALSGPLRFITESDEQFIERQRLYRRRRDLSRLRNERERRRLANRRAEYRHRKEPVEERPRLEVARKERSEQEVPREKLVAPDNPIAANPAPAAAVPDAAPSSMGVERQKIPDLRKDDAPTIATTDEDPRSPTPELEVYYDDDASLNKICRIRRACVASDGAVVVPKWMQSRMEALESCGLFTVRTMQSDSEWNATGAYSDFDLFGYVPLRYHIPHFVTDLLPFLYAHEVIRPTFSKLHTKHRTCYRKDGSPCPPDRAKEKLNIALYTENRVASMASDAWVPMLVAMIPERPHLAFPKTIFEGGGLACFRSVVAYSPHSYVRPWRGWYGPKHALFARNRISRNSVIRNPDREGLCKVQLAVLNRFGWIRRGGYLVGRDITNVEDIMTELEKGQKERGGRLKLEVSVEYFENTDFSEQVAIVQKADVILGVHGAGLGNLLFARLDVPFVEVFPFGYYAGPFERLAEALNLKYRYVVAEPDTANFNECIAKRAHQMENPLVEAKGKEAWANALKEWNNGDTRVLHSHEFKTELLSPTKLCARSQRMTLRAKQTAKLLLELADGICRRRP